MTAPRILVAEDDAALRDALRDVLAMAGFPSTAVDDGLQALAAARADPPDLIILDHLMPGLDGLSVLRALQGDARLRDIPVILLTGAAQQIAPPPGTATLIQKPFKMAPLQETVRSLLASRPAR